MIGAGKIGATVAGLLASTGDYQVTLANRSAEALASLEQDEHIRTVRLPMPRTAQSWSIC